MKENKSNQLTMKEALRYHDALSRHLKGTATTEDCHILTNTEWKRVRIKLGITDEPSGYPKDRNMI